MEKFKFELKDFVSHITDRHYRNKMVIISRYFEETTSGIIEMYMVSFFEMGQNTRQRMLVDELTVYKNKS